MSIETEIAAGLHSAEVEAALDRFAAEVRDYAKSLAPVFGDLPPHRDAPPHGDVGDYKDSIEVTKRPGDFGHRRVGSDDYKAVWIELGARHMPEYAVFAKTAAYFGGTGPIIDEGIQQAQGHLRRELEKMEKMNAEGASQHSVAQQQGRIAQARLARSAAFKAARPRRRRRR